MGNYPASGINIVNTVPSQFHLGHSQGGMNVQEWLQSHPEEELLAMYLAPIPLKGARDAVVKLIMQDANLLQLFLRSFFSKRAMQLFSEAQIRAAIGYYELYPVEVDERLEREREWTAERVRKELPFAKPQREER